MTAVTLCPHPVWGWEICGYNILWCCYVVFVPVASKPVFGFVGWEPHSGRKQSCFLFTSPWLQTLLNRLRGGVWCKLSAY